LLLLMNVLFHHDNIYSIIFPALSPIVAFVNDYCSVKWGIRVIVLSQTRSVVHRILSCDVLSVAVVEGLYPPEVQWKP
jgi:hypothetical protein